MRAIKPLNLLRLLFRREAGALERLAKKEADLARFEKGNEAAIWGAAAAERRAFLTNLVTQERHRLYEIREDIHEAAAQLVNERANEETNRLLQLKQESAKRAA